jgi:poly-gamma-glutamate synthesis protein (capsule biosynthesis protein)
MKLNWKVLSACLIAFLFLFCLRSFLTANEPFNKFKTEKEKSESYHKEETADLDGDKKGEKYVLDRGQLKIYQSDKLLWQSPEKWWIEDFALVDSNGDEKNELNLSVWKEGNFGPMMPFWVKNNDQSIKNHLFIFDFDGIKMRSIWQSSNLEAPNCSIKFEDVDKDGKLELIVVEGDYSTGAKCAPKFNAVWKWNGWGFSNESRESI